MRIRFTDRLANVIWRWRIPLSVFIVLGARCCRRAPT